MEDVSQQSTTNIVGNNLKQTINLFINNGIDASGPTHQENLAEQHHPGQLSGAPSIAQRRRVEANSPGKLVAAALFSSSPIHMSNAQKQTGPQRTGQSQWY